MSLSRLKRMNISMNRPQGIAELSNLSHDQLCAIIHELIDAVYDLHDQMYDGENVSHHMPRHRGVNFEEFPKPISKEELKGRYKISNMKAWNAY